MNLAQIIDSLEKLDTASEKEGRLRLLELIKSDAPLDEITLFGNREGLVYFALCCLSVAESQIRGAHQHFDRHSGLHKADTSLVVARKSEPSEERA